jgi:hypothetical protein
MSEFSRLSNHGDEEGHCKGCRWWQGEREIAAEEDAVGLCMHQELTHFSLQVSAHSGCNRFEHAEVGELAGML